MHVVDVAAEAATSMGAEVGALRTPWTSPTSAAVDRLFSDVVAADGCVDVVVHCAGVDDPQAKAWIQEAGTRAVRWTSSAG